MRKKYENLGIFPLEFNDGFKRVQQVEAGETFTRDFEATSGIQHERWLMELGHIREVIEPADVTKTPSGPVPTTDKKE